MDEAAEATKRCSFCRKNTASVRYLITAPRSSICDECVVLSLEILLEKGFVSRARLIKLLFSW
jgi:ATP-dependent protease Clp ATPase subunit